MVAEGLGALAESADQLHVYGVVEKHLGNAYSAGYAALVGHESLLSQQCTEVLVRRLDGLADVQVRPQVLARVGVVHLGHLFGGPLGDEIPSPIPGAGA